MENNKFTPQPKPFDGKQGEAMQWLRKFKGYVGVTNIEDGPTSHSFYMMFEGSADNSFCSLADNQKDTLQHIYEAIEEQYGYNKKNSDPNFLLRFEKKKAETKRRRFGLHRSHAGAGTTD